MRGRSGSAPGPGLAPMAQRAPRPRANSGGAARRNPMPANLQAQIRQMRAARNTLTPMGLGGGNTIARASRAIDAARSVTGIIGGNANGALSQNLVSTVARHDLTVRDPGGLGGLAMLSPRNHRGVGLAITPHGGDVAQATRFLGRAGRALENIGRTNVGTTLLNGLDAAAVTHAGQFNNSPTVTLSAVHPIAEGVVGSSAAPHFAGGGRGASSVSWDMAQSENPAWNQLTNDSVILGHEMTHGWRRARGENYFTNPRGVVGADNISRREELETSGLTPSTTPVNENMLRGALGVRPRHDYEGLRPDPGYMERGRRVMSAWVEWNRGRNRG